ncbi:thymidine kinase [Phaeodactylibacter luteus]|uniref:Thymidine kinase n=1 Tax=Phaeodactylibacter luteus TaxID=1564516 RepID=A0A5C6RJV2_9BACT|nr:thymidine kinase [Phaeodactylibacter luteus]TXB62453.1 thymidine kinase [Phaeodactylibacter luteus]
MFLEPHFKGQRSGWIEVICGSMFSGKTEELIRRLKRAKIANQRVEIFKPKIDTRYDEAKVVSHDANYILSTPIAHSSSLIGLAEGVNVVGVDEAQFFDEELPEVCQMLALKGVRVIVAGLDMDFRGKPFGPMPNLLAVAEYITKVHAICQHCGNLATHSYRFVPNNDTVVLGEKEAYEPRCRTCYHMGNILDLKSEAGKADEKPGRVRNIDAAS